MFAEKYGAKYDKAVTCLTKDRDKLLTFYDFPAEHWDHLRTSDEIDKPELQKTHRFSVRLRSAVFLPRPRSEPRRAQRRSRVAAGHRAAVRSTLEGREHGATFVQAGRAVTAMRVRSTRGRMDPHG